LGKPGKGKGERGKEKRVGGVSVAGAMKSGDGIVGNFVIDVDAA
jgi:hypothetical protein